MDIKGITLSGKERKKIIFHFEGFDVVTETEELVTTRSLRDLAVEFNADAVRIERDV